MYKIPLFLILFWTSVATAGVINVEFKFTPYVGDPLKSDQVETVPGNARVFINNVLFAEQEVRKDNVQVLFEERDISPSIWVPASSLGAALRKGKNSIRIEFVPADAKKPYNAQISWVSVMDQSTEKSEGGRYQATNQSDAGKEDKKTMGKVVLQREFVADFAADLPWHHYPPMASLSDEDKKSLALIVKKRAEAFKPDFAYIYELLGKNPNMNPVEVKKSRCLDQAYAAGIRVAAPTRNQLDFAMTGNPEVVVSRKDGAPLYPFDESSFARIKGDEARMCAAMAISVAFPPRLIVVRSPSGIWEVAY
ncbi:hypothetical protein [Geotalea uraniireducens]|uniref:Uncharacterized protein n=1 Tax=Geotalea uraniireducens (strain Rf4) TaxID=351605 RepID=A5GBP8_GEOUR|nr:hypothetical protein [Geotalea uraniireducens]ABQ25008.1 hypothetical protein Gura_0800 [Geotalea uraniireducens Rf4]